MSPEILLGHEFDLPTDIFSLGVIFAEIACRKLASDTTFKRLPPTFGIDTDEVRDLLSEGCPQAFIQLTLDCLQENPKVRPTTRAILDRLREIELEVMSRSTAEEAHVGSIKFLTGNRRPGAAPRIPSFGMGVGRDGKKVADAESDESSDEEELAEALDGLKNVGIQDTWSRNAASKHSYKFMLSSTT